MLSDKSQSYIDIVAFDEEPLPKGRPLTKKELSKLNKEAKLLNITNNRKAKNIAKHILDNFDRTLVDTLDLDTAVYLNQFLFNYQM